MRLHQRSAVGDRADGGRHLQRRDADLIAHGHRRERAVVHPHRVPDDARVLAAEVRAQRLAESVAADVAAQPLRPEPQSHLDRADVARLDDDVGERERAVAMDVEDRLAAANLDEARRAVDPVVGPDHALLQGRRCGDDLERRPGLVEVLDGAVAPLALVGPAERVRVERRPVGEREDLAGQRIHDHRAAAGGTVLFDARAQLALGDVLQVLIDGQLERRTLGGRTIDAAVERMAARVGLDAGPCPRGRAPARRRSTRGRQGRCCRARRSRARAPRAPSSGSSAGSP